MNTINSVNESKAVAWRYPDARGRFVFTHGNITPYPDAEPLVPESALHAAEAELADFRKVYIERKQQLIDLAKERDTLQAELGELRRRVSELASDLVVLAKHHEIRADRPYQDEGTTNWHSGYDEGITECADRLRQLLASDGGSDGDGS